MICEGCGEEFIPTGPQQRYCLKYECKLKKDLANRRRSKEQRGHSPVQSKYLYRRTPQDYQLVLELQGGHCALCPSTGPFHWDHDHSCCPGRKTCGGCIRGLLCRQCNARMRLVDSGWLQEWLSRALEYQTITRQAM